MKLAIALAMCTLVAAGTSILDKHLSGNTRDILTGVGWVFAALECVALTGLRGKR